MLILLLFLILSCFQNPEDNKINTPIIESGQDVILYSDVVLYDKFHNELLLDTLSDNSTAQFSPVYIGALKDSIHLTYKPSKIKNRTSNWFKYRRPSPKDLEIFIDTTKTIGFSMDVWGYYKKSEYRVGKKSYPVFVHNKSSDTLSIGLGDIFYMTTEAKDVKGQWTEMESPFIYGCGTGLTVFYLPPDEVVITSLRQNFGTTNTEFRVKHDVLDGVIYSNVIQGKI